MDTCLIDKKRQELPEVLAGALPDKLSGMFASLVDNIILVNGSPTSLAGSIFDIVYTLNFDTTIYDQVLAAARTFKANFAHW